MTVNKNLTLTKKETVVLFDMLGLSDIPCSIGDMPAVTSHEYTDISRALYDMQAFAESTTVSDLTRALIRFFFRSDRQTAY